MSGRLKSQSYGKHRVRVSKVIRPRQATPNTELHQFVEVTVDVELQGDFDAAYTEGDNSAVIATDTCKNTVYALAKDDPLDSIESFGLTIAKYFLDQFAHVTSCHVTLNERIWNRLLESPHAFVASDQATPTAKIVLARDQPPLIHAGVEHLLIAKTTESGFSDFHESEFRTLVDTDDRILATEFSGSWKLISADTDFATARAAIMDALLARFIDHYSRSVQETLYKMAESALDACSSIDEITLTMPNKHHLLADLSRLNRENENEIFVVTDEPFGFITATIGRE